MDIHCLLTLNFDKIPFLSDKEKKMIVSKLKKNLNNCKEKIKKCVKSIKKCVKSIKNDDKEFLLVYMVFLKSKL